MWHTGKVTKKRTFTNYSVRTNTGKYHHSATPYELRNRIVILIIIDNNFEITDFSILLDKVV